MRSSRTIDLSTGLFVLLGFAAILFLVTQITNREFSLGGSAYRVQAQFENIGGLKAGAPVSMSGVTIGRVESIGFDMDVLKAIVTLRIDGRYDRIPEDSDASIFTAGLLGGQYIGITPGGSEASLPVTLIDGNIVSPEIENPKPMSPAPFMAALAIQRWFPSAGAYVPCWWMLQFNPLLRSSYQRMPARSNPFVSTV